INNKIPKSVDEMMRATAAFLRGSPWRNTLLRSSKIIPLECTMVSGPKVQPFAITQVAEERIKVAIHPEYLEQTIAIGSTLTEDGRKELMSSGQIEEKKPSTKKKQGNTRGSGKTCGSRHHEGISLPQLIGKFDRLEGGIPLRIPLQVLPGCVQRIPPNKNGKEGEEKTSFITSQGIFYYSKMPFGLKNAGATYQRLVDKAFQKQICRNLDVYVDDLADSRATYTNCTNGKERTYCVPRGGKRSRERSLNDRRGQSKYQSTSNVNSRGGRRKYLDDFNYEYLTEETLFAENKKARAVRLKSRWYAVINGVLYKKSFLEPLLRCVGPLQASYLMREIHKRPCNMHAGPRTEAVIIDMVQNDEALKLNLDLLEEKREQATILEARSKAKIEKYYNSNIRNTSFKPRDLVYRSNDASHAEDGGNLGPKWEGLYEVIEALGR
nr:reverse transcriptase domain-containing protein [Tanacetum cinerariifolium]